MAIIPQDRLDALIATPSVCFAAAALASAAMLGTAFIFQYAGGLFPCELCLLQRYPYGAVIVLGGLGAVALRRQRRPGVLAFGLGAVIALLFATDAGIAAFHVGVEQGWWHGTEACVGADVDTSDLEAMREAILAAPAVRCDEVVWSLFGLSIAAWNGLAALALTILSAAVLWRWRRA
jgi:disulfide bond formation protein DsbB